MPTIPAEGPTVPDAATAHDRRRALVLAAPNQVRGLVTTQLAQAGHPATLFTDEAVSHLATHALAMLRPLTNVSQAAVLLAHSENVANVTGDHIDRIVAIRNDVIGRRSAPPVRLRPSPDRRFVGRWVAAAVALAATTLFALTTDWFRTAPLDSEPIQGRASAEPARTGGSGEIETRSGDIAAAQDAAPVASRPAVDQIVTQPENVAAAPSAAPDSLIDSATESAAATASEAPPAVVNMAHIDNEIDRTASSMLVAPLLPLMPATATPPEAPHQHSGRAATHRHASKQKPIAAPSDRQVGQPVATLEPPKPIAPGYWAGRR